MNDERLQKRLYTQHQLRIELIIKRRNHSSAFKAKVAVAALKNDKTMTELAEQFDVHPNQTQDWRKKLLENADTVFGRGEKERADAVGQIKELHAKIGQLTMERDFSPTWMSHRYT